MVLSCLLLLAAVSARAQTKSDFDFMVGRWSGRETCRTGVYDVTFEASRCENSEGRYCQDAYRGSATTVARTPGRHGGTGAGAGNPTTLASDINVSIQLPFAVLEGGAHYAKATQTGRFASTGAKVGGVTMPIPYGLQGTFTISRKGRQLSYIVDINGPEGPDHCGGNLARQETASVPAKDVSGRSSSR